LFIFLKSIFNIQTIKILYFRNVLRKKTQGGVLQKLLKKAEIEKKKESNEGLSLSDFLKSM